ncbi:MAG: methylenetetrahydrofolate reductase [NAD(P)H] [Fimbriimonadaceae bacterium]|nr:methylenetetrahydrofolate reductase [NAD(P)H] [Fimbriimonadaceae bacterium]QYK59393.1 MAG: methylenetetrahydrofolate reductase [NAD(P)H] [Fimbriimonadaceae bacterium]
MRVAEMLADSEPTFSFEFFPPKTEAGVRRLYSTIEHLAELRPGFVSVTYGAGGSTRELTVETTDHIKNRLGIETVAHLTCRGHSVEEIDSVLNRLESAGIENVLALRGDPLKGDAVRPPSAFEYAQGLVAHIARRGQYCIGAACYPEGHVENPDRQDDLCRLVEKVNAGSDFLITQLFFENAVYFDFVTKARAQGIQVPIVPGLMPVTNVAQLERFTAMCGATVPHKLRTRLTAVQDDDQAVMAIGIEWCLEQARELLARGAPGIHFYTLNRSLATRVVCRSLT